MTNLPGPSSHAQQASPDGPRLQSALMRPAQLANLVRELLRDVQRVHRLQREVEATKVLLGQILSELQREPGQPLQRYEFRVFSQWGEDGILQHLTRHVPLAERTFIEFGVEDFTESNCRYLLTKDNWRGFVLDGSEVNVAQLRSSELYWQRSLTAQAAFVTRENIRNLLSGSGFNRDVGVLSVDIDGMDFFVLQAALTDWKPRICVVEYNAVFGGTRPVSVPYRSDFTRQEAHHSNLYFGASLPAFNALLEDHGYSLVGVNAVGNNAFFVRSELCSDAVPAVHVGEVFQPSTFRESRDSAGALTYLVGDERRTVIADLPLVDTVTGETLRVEDL